MGNVSLNRGRDGTVNYPITLAELVVVKKDTKLSDLIGADDSGNLTLSAEDVHLNFNGQTYSMAKVIAALLSLGIDSTHLTV